jgi:uncharacterized protein DUF3303
MLYMVIEHFKNGDAGSVYDRFRSLGRLLPDGLTYLASWVDAESPRCFQLMETEDAATLDLWTSRWSDLVDFEIVPVVTSAQAAATHAARAGSPTAIL